MNRLKICTTVSQALALFPHSAFRIVSTFSAKSFHAVVLSIFPWRISINEMETRRE